MIQVKALSVVGSFLFFAGAALWSQEFEDLPPALKEQAVILDITARVLEKNSQEIWNSSRSSKVTIPGRSVGIRLVGANVVVTIQFTPYLRNDGNNILVAQGQIWVDVPNQGMSYQTTMQTIPIAFGEQVYFLPLGSSSSNGDTYIEILLELRPYSAETSAQTAGNENK
jgi:hypothetical protein